MAREYRTIPIYKEDWKRLKEISVEEATPITKLMKRLLDSYKPHQDGQQKEVKRD